MADSWAYTDMLGKAYPYTASNIHECTRAHTHIRAHERTRTHTRRSAHTRKCTRGNESTHTFGLTRTRTLMHARTHAYMAGAHAFARARTLTPALT